jgi:hypothetical protein
MRFHRSAVAACLVAACVNRAEYAIAFPEQSIRVGEHVRVSVGLESRPLVEPHLAVHPSDPTHLLAATIVSDAARAWGETQTCSTFLSRDGGRTWRRHDFAITECGDPWVAITPGGHAVFLAIGTHKMLPDQARGGLIVFHSGDGGTTWDESPNGLAAPHDHATLVVDRSVIAHANWVYVVSTRNLRVEGKARSSVFVSRSMDGGKTFGPATTVIPSNLNLNAEIPVVLSNGALLVPFGDFQRNVDDFRGAGFLDRRREWVLKSTDAGHTFSVPLFATEACSMGWTALAADASSAAFRDRIYLACRDTESGSIVVASSSDGGEVWTEPIPVRRPLGGVTLEQPALAIARGGMIGIAWIEANQPRPGCARLYVTASLDGARTFLPPQQVSDRPACGESGGNGAALIRWPTGGDYFGMVSTGDGRFRLLWSDARDKVFQLWSAPVIVDGKVVKRQ